MTDKHEDTIGTFAHNGKTYDIDWPSDPDDDTARNPLFGAIYLDGRQVGECSPNYFGVEFTDAGQVLSAAVRVIVDGDTDDQEGQ